MTNQQFYLLLNELDDELLIAAEVVPNAKPTRRTLLRLISVAACAVVVIAAVLFSAPYVQNMIDPPIQPPTVEQPAPTPPTDEPPAVEPPVEKETVYLPLFGTPSEETPSTPGTTPGTKPDTKPDTTNPEFSVAKPWCESFEEFHAAIIEKTFATLPETLDPNVQYATQYCRPAVIPEGYVLDYILVYENEFMYYYKVNDPSYLTTSTYSNITVTVSRQASETAKADLEKQRERKTDENGCIYQKSIKTLWTTINGYQIKIAVSPDLNDYDTLRSLCELEKVTLVAGVGVVDNAVVDNALAVK